MNIMYLHSQKKKKLPINIIIDSFNFKNNNNYYLHWTRLTLRK